MCFRSIDSRSVGGGVEGNEERICPVGALQTEHIQFAYSKIRFLFLLFISLLPTVALRSIENVQVEKLTDSRTMYRSIHSEG